jgi:hypothetical protein
MSHSGPLIPSHKSTKNHLEQKWPDRNKEQGRDKAVAKPSLLDISPEAVVVVAVAEVARGVV